MKKDLIKKIIIGLIFSLVISSITLLFYRKIWPSLFAFGLSLSVFFVYEYLKEYFKTSARIKKIEDVFPDFLQLMSSNLRAGMTIDRAMLLSSRPEFAPLDEEILKTGRDITIGKNIDRALLGLAKRIGSSKIDKIIFLIISGIRSGGDLAILLEQTSRGLRDRSILEKKAASSILMYVIFIFLAVSIFAPALFSLSNVLVTVLTNIFSGLPDIQNTNINLPFSLSKINISTTFVFYFSIFFMITIDILAAMVLGLVNKGEERQGLKFLPILIVLSLTVFFLTRIIVGNFVGSLF
ncbi:type II secretion system F family protein [Candidatus Pacearchaeota archaeon]|nr:type II secretion system F family protein [Candidatus Pacearchaeota archaeon]